MALIPIQPKEQARDEVPRTVQRIGSRGLCGEVLLIQRL